MLSIKKPGFCTHLFNPAYTNGFDALYHSRIMRAANLAYHQGEAATIEINKALNAAIAMNGKDFTEKYLLFMNDIELISPQTYNLLHRRITKENNVQAILQ